MGNWTVLARGGEGSGVSRCPEGHIHVDYGAVTLRFDDEQFLAFARMVSTAAASVTGVQWIGALELGGDNRFSQN